VIEALTRVSGHVPTRELPTPSTMELATATQQYATTILRNWPSRVGPLPTPDPLNNIQIHNLHTPHRVACGRSILLTSTNFQNPGEEPVPANKLRPEAKAYLSVGTRAIEATGLMVYG
jgi:hypothetical protein